MMKKRILRMVIAMACICVLFALPVRALAATSAKTYTDEEGGVTFTVPAGWTEMEKDESDQYIDAQFENEEIPYQIIIYGSVDVWSQTTAVERAGMSREEYDLDLFTKQDMVEMYADFDVSEDQVEEVTYNGYRYYKTVVTVDDFTFGLHGAMTMIQLFRVENGWGYLFQFTGEEESILYPDFERMVKSARYTQTAQTDDEMLSVTGIIVLIAVVAVVIVATVLIITFLRRRASAARVEALKAQAEQEALRAQAEQEALRAQQAQQAQQAAEEEKQFCHLCGTQVPLGSEFCHQCGGKL